MSRWDDKSPCFFNSDPLTLAYIWVIPKIGGKTPKWMVKIRENPIKFDDLGGKPPLFLETSIYQHLQVGVPNGSVSGCQFTIPSGLRTPPRLEGVYMASTLSLTRFFGILSFPETLVQKLLHEARR